jgi:4-phytase / acid phosphatase
MSMFRMRSALPGWLLAVAMGAPVAAQTVVANDSTILKQIVIFGRHGVRSPVASPAQYALFSPRPYPDFGVSVGYLTVQGQQAEVLLGAYYRDYLLAEGLLTGNAGSDLGQAYFRANSIQRSNLTATMLGEGLIPGATIPVHSYPLNQPDPVFDPISTGVAAVAANRAANEVQAIFNSGTALAFAYSSEFSLIRSVLFNYPMGEQPPPATPPGVTDPTAQAIPLTAVTSGVAAGNVVNTGGVGLTDIMADPFIMEYTDGLPLAEVGWGELPTDAVSEATRFVILNQRVNFRTPYLDEVQSSNAAAHVLRSMEQAVFGSTVPGAFSAPTDRILVVISSDDYVAGLAGLLQTHWQLAGYQPDYCAPGGALVFELRQSTITGEFLVRVYYTAQSADQLRNLTPLSLTAPPETAQLLIPGGSRPGGSLDVEFGTFQKLMESAIGRQYVQDPSTEVPPGVLTGVPTQ